MTWWPADKWEQMRRGEECGMCWNAHLPSNPFSDLIAATAWSYVRLHRNQTHPGYSVVIAKRHAPELHELSPDERCGLWSDVAAVGKAVSTLFRPVKLANLSMGFRMPHYHCHVYPQYENDDPFRLIDVTEGDVRLEDEEWQDRLVRVRARFLDSADE
jgi:diadenosine tetraphosphate (Ap4A) HIT family hydrolase